MKTHKLKLKLTKQQCRIIRDYCYYSNNLYNYSLYVCKQSFKETNKYIGYNQLYHEVKNNENYKLLPSQTACQIIRLVDKDYRSFFALLNRKLKGQYQASVNSPKFKKRGDLFNLIYTNQTIISTKNSNVTLCLSSYYNKLHGIKSKQGILKFKLSIPNCKQIKQIIIRPYNNGQYFKMFIQYEEVQNVKINLNKSKHLGIDLGINNLATCFNSTSGHSFIVNGKPLKSYNRWYNKTKAKLSSELETKQHRKWSNQLQTITENRYNYIDNYFNQVVSKITKYCISQDIGSLIIGYNQSWKNESNKGSEYNQRFNSIPHNLLKQKLEHKCIENGITFTQVEESYTSKSSFVDSDILPKYKPNNTESYVFSGKRPTRGRYKTKTGILVNADVNGAANICRKVVSDIACNQEILGLMLNPMKRNFFS